jgi:peptide/nickel transport system permease protein
MWEELIPPIDPTVQNRELPYAPPTRLHFVDASGFHPRPSVYASLPDLDGYREDVAHKYPLHLFVRGGSYKILGILRSNVHLFGVDEPARILVLGADAYGRDEFSRLLYGGQISLAAGLLATLLALATATVIGTVSGYYGRWVDESLMAPRNCSFHCPGCISCSACEPSCHSMSVPRKCFSY